MKIGIEAQRIFCPKKYGMDIYALELIRAIQQLDTQNEYVIFVKPGKDVCLQPSQNFKIVEVNGRTYFAWEQVSLPKAIEQEKIDLMHFTSNTASVSIKCPFILTLHDIIYLENFFSKGSLHKVVKHFYCRWNVPKIAHKADYILTVSEFEKIQIQKALGIKYTKLKAVYNASNQYFRMIEDEVALEQIREKYNLPYGFIFFLGSKEPKKNMKRILAAYAVYVDETLNPINLVIAEGSENEIIQLLSEINRKDILEKIVLTGYLQHSELPYIYNLATLFLYPSLRESFGIPIIEAMACGTPVITSNVSAMPEVADDAAMLVNPYDVESITQVIKKVLNNQKLYNHLKYSGLSRATAFSWKNTAEKTIQLYAKILNTAVI